MMHWGDYGWGWGMGFGWLFMIIFWVLVTIGIVYLIQAVARRSKEEDKETPIDILKKRYAKGEITKDEYDRMKDELSEH